MKTKMGKRLGAAYELLNIQKQRDLVFELISKYDIDRYMSLQEILDESNERKTNYATSLTEMSMNWMRISWSQFSVSPSPIMLKVDE